MSHYHSILLAVDVFEHGDALLQKAQHFAQQSKAKLSLVYTLPAVAVNVPYAVDFQSNIDNDAKERLATLQQSLKLDDKDTYLLHGSAKVEIPTQKNIDNCQFIKNNDGRLPAQKTDFDALKIKKGRPCPPF